MRQRSAPAPLRASWRAHVTCAPYRCAPPRTPPLRAPSNPGTWIASLLSVIPATAWQLVWLLTASSTFYHFYQRGERYTYTDKAGHTRESVDLGPLGVLALVYLVLSTYWCARRSAPRPRMRSALHDPPLRSPPRARPRAARRTTQVLANVVHVTNSGVVGTWYFRQDRMPARPTLGALGRSLTSSFGSICLGSLLVAMIQLLHDLAESARRNSSEGGILANLVRAPSRQRRAPASAP